jgi:hypothetical protein
MCGRAYALAARDARGSSGRRLHPQVSFLFTGPDEDTVPPADLIVLPGSMAGGLRYRPSTMSMPASTRSN